MEEKLREKQKEKNETTDLDLLESDESDFLVLRK